MYPFIRGTFRRAIGYHSFSTSVREKIVFELPSSLTRGTVTKLAPKLWVCPDDVVAQIDTESGVVIDLRAPCFGIIRELHKKMGDTASLGDTIVVIEPREISKK